MKYTVIVTGPLYGNQKSTTAFLFSCAVISLGHSIKKIFFYSDGVFNANKMVYPPSNELNLFDSWKKFGFKNNIVLCLCISSALRRGIICTEQAIRMGFKEGNLGSGFKLTGLSELFDAIQKSDRVIKF